MSIIHISDCFLPRLGGIEVQVAGVAREQAAAGERVHVVTATRRASPGQGHDVHRIAMRLPWDVPVHPRAGTHLERLLPTLDPAVVYVHVGAISPFAWSGVRSALRLGLPTVAVVHSMWDPAVQRFYRLLRGSAGAPLVLAAVSEAAADRMRAALPGVDVAVVPNGITPAQWRGIPVQRSDDTVHVVSVGRLAARKQPMALLRALRAAGEHVRLRATIAGDGPELGAMVRYLRKHDMGWVRLPGRLGREGVRRLLDEADVFVNPTVCEAFGLATLEARTAGVPIVARPRTGVSDFVHHGVEGLITDDLAGGIIRLATNHQERLRMTRHNRTTEPRHCTWPSVLTTLRDLGEHARTGGVRSRTS